MATILTHDGKAIITNRIKGSGTEPKYIGWGTGTTTAAVGDHALTTEDVTGGYARVSGTSSQYTTAQTNDTYQVVGTLTAGATLAIAEVGTFDAATTGNICVHGNFTAISLAASDSIAFTIRVQFT